MFPLLVAVVGGAAPPRPRPGGEAAARGLQRGPGGALQGGAGAEPRAVRAGAPCARQ